MRTGPAPKRSAAVQKEELARKELEELREQVRNMGLDVTALQLHRSKRIKILLNRVARAIALMTHMALLSARLGFRCRAAPPLRRI